MAKLIEIIIIITVVGIILGILGSLFSFIGMTQKIIDLGTWLTGLFVPLKGIINLPTLYTAIVIYINFRLAFWLYIVCTHIAQIFIARNLRLNQNTGTKSVSRRDSSGNRITITTPRK